MNHFGVYPFHNEIVKNKSYLYSYNTHEFQKFRTNPVKMKYSNSKSLFYMKALEDYTAFI